MRVCLGGTFNKFHRAHKKLIDLVLSIGDENYIGVTSDEYTKKVKKKKRGLKTFQERASVVADYVEDKATVFKLNDYAGPAMDEIMDAVVVSEETLPNALKINKERSEKGFKELAVFVIPTMSKKELGE